MASQTTRETTEPASRPPSAAEIERFVAIVGAANAFTDAKDRARFDEEQRGAFPGASALVLRPGSTREVAEIVALASRMRRPIVPQGGNTGLVGAGVARGRNAGDGLDIVVSLSRMNAVRDLDPQGNTITVEAGCVLDLVRGKADEANRLFPLKLGSGGSAQIGGLVSSNAGGTGVIAYGNTRDLVLGLEAVMPDGRVWNGLSRLRKNNTGYDLKHLLIGGEGTLGIVTAATLKLFPKPAGRSVAFAALPSPDAALSLLDEMRGRAGAGLTGFELIARAPLAMAIEHMGDRDPFATPHPWYALLEVSSGASDEEARAMLERGLGAALEDGSVEDAVLATSIAQAEAFWTLRENCAWAQRHEGGSIKHDISVPIHAIPEFVRRAERAVHSVVPDARVVCFGHMGDGNLHYNVSQPVDADRAGFLARTAEVNDAVFEVVLALEGSISAEHGIGQQKRDRLPKVKSAVEMDLMRAVKRAIDPLGIMNPGKLL